MTGFRCSIIEGIETLSRSSTADAIWNQLKACAKARGFDHLLVIRSRNDEETVLFNDLPAGFIEMFEDGGFCDHPAIRDARADLRPYTAAEFWAMALTADQRRTLARASMVFGIRDGLLIPIRIAGELEGLVIVAGRAPEMGPVIRSSLHLFAHIAFEQATALEKAPVRKVSNPLSPREVECLRWAAAGKTDAEIGALLNISARTARFHFENAKKKLGVATRVQAVTEALRINAIAA